MSNILDKYIKYEFNEHDFIITFKIQLPSEGQYGLDIYACNPEYQAEKRTMSHCCKYIMNYSKASVSQLLPDADMANINNNLDHKYLSDNSKLNGELKVLSSPTNLCNDNDNDNSDNNNNNNNNKYERSLSPREYIKTITILEPRGSNPSIGLIRIRSDFTKFSLSR